MFKKILLNARNIRILIVLLTVIFFVIIFMISKNNKDEKLDYINIDLTYVSKGNFKGKSLEENKFVNIDNELVKDFDNIRYSNYNDLKLSDKVNIKDYYNLNISRNNIIRK